MRQHRRSNEERILGTPAKTPDQVQLAGGGCLLGGFQPHQRIGIGEMGLLPAKPRPPRSLAAPSDACGSSSAVMINAFYKAPQLAKVFRDTQSMSVRKMLHRTETRQKHGVSKLREKKKKS